MQADHDFVDRLAAAEIDDGDGAFIRNKTPWINAHARAAAGGAGNAVGFGTATAPIADVGFATGDHDIVRGDADIDTSAEYAGVSIQFEQLVREIPDDIENLFIRGEKQARRNFSFALREAGVRE